MKTRKSPLQLLHTPRPKIGSPILLSGQNGITHLAHFKKILNDEIAIAELNSTCYIVLHRNELTAKWEPINEFEDKDRAIKYARLVIKGHYLPTPL